MARERWRTTFDILGLAAYFTIVSGGELPDRELLAAVRRGGTSELVTPLREASAPEQEREPAGEPVAA